MWTGGYRSDSTLGVELLITAVIDCHTINK